VEPFDVNEAVLSLQWLTEKGTMGLDANTSALEVSALRVWQWRQSLAVL